MHEADLMVTDIDWAITVDPTRRVIRDAAIAVKDGRIAAIGKTVRVATSCRERNARAREQ